MLTSKEARLREALVKWFEEVYEAYNRGNIFALMLKDLAVDMFKRVVSTVNLADYTRELYLILKEYFEGG